MPIVAVSAVLDESGQEEIMSRVAAWQRKVEERTGEDVDLHIADGRFNHAYRLSQPFPEKGQNLVFSLLVAIAVAVVTGLIMRKTLLQGESTGFMMELPPYHLLFLSLYLCCGVYENREGQNRIP